MCIRDSGALGKAYDYLLAHDALRARLGVSRQEDALLALEPTRGPGDYLSLIHI